MTTCSPLLSLVQAVDNTAQTLNNSQASDRLKALQTASAVAQGYSAVADLAQGVLARAEVGVGFRYGESKERYYELTSQGNVINGKQGVSLNATDGSITLNKTELTTKDAYGQLNKAGEVRLSAKEHIQLYSGRSEMESESKRTHYGAQVGTGVQVGANSGWYLYAEGGLGQDKSKSHIHHKDNSHIQAGKLNIQAGGDVTLKGASAYAEQIQGHIGGKLYIESEQSHERHSQSSAGLNGRVQGGYGAWGGSVSGQYAQGNGRLSQVEEQAGLFAGNGGYQLVAKETHLKGGAIASTNPALSFLATNHLRFEDIKNESGSRAISLNGGLSYSTGGNKENSQNQNSQGNPTQTSPTNSSPMQITSGQYWEKVSNEIGKPLQGEGGQGFSSSLGLPQYEKHSDSSLTRATLTAGTLILNKDSQPIITTPEAIGINTDLNLANEQVEKPKDIQRLLTEQKATAQALSDMANAAGVYARHKWQETGDERWKDGGSHKRKLDAAVAALGTALGGGSFGQVATAAISPELNAKIHEATKDSKAMNLLAHAALSALEAKVTGHSATAGAAAGLIGEGSAMLLSEAVLNKPAELLTAEERSLLKAAGLVAGAAAGGVVGGNTASATFGAETGKRAVENNYLYVGDVQDLVKELAKAEKEGRDPKEVFDKYRGISEKNREEMLAECGNNPICYASYLDLIRSGNEAAYENFSPLRVTSYFNGLSSKARAEMSDFVERENGKTYSVLPNSVHYAGTAVDAVAAAGLGGISLAGKWKDKPYTSSGMDKHSREKVGDSDYPDNIHFSIKLKTHLIDGEGLSQKKGIIGGHNEVNFRNLLEQYGGRISRIENTDVEGITRIYYQIPRLGRDGKPDGTYKDAPSPKTVYDPSKYSDSYILEMGMRAAAKGYNSLLEKNRLNSRITQETIYLDGINYHIYLNPETKGVNNVHPQ